MPEPWKPIANKLDELDNDGFVSEATEYLLKLNEQERSHPQVLWRTCRALYRSAQETVNPAERGPLMKQALGTCEASLKADPKNPSAHTWTGIVLGKQDVSTKQRVGNAMIIRDHFAEALASAPHDPLTLHSIGVWCRTVLDVSWAERKIAAVLFGEPPTCTPAECLQYLLHSAKEGDMIQNATLLGDVYVQYKKDKPTAKQWYERAMNMPVNTAAKARMHDEAVRKFNSL